MKKYIIAILSVVILVAFDQWTKALAVFHLKGKPSISLIKGVFEFSYVENRGAAFGILQNQRWFLLTLTTAVMLMIVYVFIRLPSKKFYLPMQIICVLLLSGALGNMIDRVWNQFVVDFLYFSLIDFPTFNVADIYVTVTGFAFVIIFLFFYKEEDFEFLNPFKKRTSD